MSDQAAPMPAVFNDPLAERTEWTPMEQGAATFDKHRLVQVRPGRIEFRWTLQYKFCCAFMAGFL
ncbi:MAG: hypothetical protein ACYS8X_11445, partial [Planctomycetota bacterium]